MANCDEVAITQGGYGLTRDMVPPSSSTPPTTNRGKERTRTVQRAAPISTVKMHIILAWVTCPLIILDMLWCQGPRSSLPTQGERTQSTHFNGRSRSTDSHRRRKREGTTVTLKLEGWGRVIGSSDQPTLLVLVFVECGFAEGMPPKRCTCGRDRTDWVKGARMSTGGCGPVYRA